MLNLRCLCDIQEEMPNRPLDICFKLRGKVCAGEITIQDLNGKVIRVDEITKKANVDWEEVHGLIPGMLLLLEHKEMIRNH